MAMGTGNLLKWIVAFRRMKSPPSATLIPLHAPELSGNESRLVQECLESGWVSSAGPWLARFERAFAARAGVPHAVAVVNGTSGLHLALKAAGVEPGDGVLVPDLTFAAPVNAVHYCGARPIFLDADPQTWQMDAAALEEFLAQECELRDGACFEKKSGNRVRAALPVHLLGSACDMDRILPAARSSGLRVVEDAAEAVGTLYRGRQAGTLGDCGVFSFNGNKIITAGGGGMVVSRDEMLAERVRYLANQAKDDPEEYFHRELGYNYRLSSVQAALGLAQLERLDAFLARKRQVAAAYGEALGRLAGLEAMRVAPEVSPNFWLYTFLLPRGVAAEGRRAFIGRLREEGVEARSLWHPMHSLPVNAPLRAFRIRHAPELFARAVSIPSGPGLTDAQVERVIAALAAAHSRL